MSNSSFSPSIFFLFSGKPSLQNVGGGTCQILSLFYVHLPLCLFFTNLFFFHLGLLLSIHSSISFLFIFCLFMLHLAVFFPISHIYILRRGVNFPNFHLFCAFLHSISFSLLTSLSSSSLLSLPVCVHQLRPISESGLLGNVIYIGLVLCMQ